MKNLEIFKCSEENVKQLQMRKVPIQNVYPDATLLFVENSPKDDYNASKVAQLNHLEIKIESIDIFSDSTKNAFANITFCRVFWYNCRLIINLEA